MESDFTNIIFWLCMLIYIVVYWIGRLIAWIIGRLIKRDRLPQRTVGTVLVVLCALSIFAYTTGFITTRESFNQLDPYTQGQAIGRIINAVFWPALIVALFTGIFALIRRRSAKKVDS